MKARPPVHCLAGGLIAGGVAGRRVRRYVAAVGRRGRGEPRGLSGVVLRRTDRPQDYGLNGGTTPYATCA